MVIIIDILIYYLFPFPDIEHFKVSTLLNKKELIFWIAADTGIPYFLLFKVINDITVLWILINKLSIILLY